MTTGVARAGDPARLNPAPDPHPPEMWFRSIAVFADVSAGALHPGAEALAEFLARHDRWYRATVGPRPDLFYNRELSLSERMPLALAPEAERLGAACKALGYGFSISVHLDEEEEPDVSALGPLLESGVVTGIGVIAPLIERVAAWSEERRRRWAERCLDVFASDAQVGIVGDLLTLRHLGLLRAETVNRSNVTLYPHDRDWAQRGARRPSGEASPCFARFRVYVDPVGRVFPCLGFLVAETEAFGTIATWPEEGYALADHPAGLGRLAARGPEGQQTVADRRGENLPLVCERHLAHLALDTTVSLTTSASQ